MGCTPSRVQPEQANTESEPIVAAPAPATSTPLDDAPVPVAIITAPPPENEVQPFRPTSSSSSEAAGIETSAAVVRPVHHSQPSQSLRPDEFSASHTQQSSPRSQAQLSPSSQRQQPNLTTPAQPTAMHSPPSASSAPRVSILKVPGEKKPRKDWDAIRAAKQAAVSPQHKKSATLEEKELEEVTPDGGGGEGEQKEYFAQSPVIRNIVRTQSSSSQHSTSQRRLNRPQSFPVMPTVTTQDKDTPPSQSPSNQEAATRPVRLADGNGGNSRQNSFRTVGGGGKKPKKRRTSHQGMMSKLALQFPAVRASFGAVYTSFQQFCHMTVASTDSPLPTVVSPVASISALGHISLEKFPALLEHLTHHNCTFSQEQVLNLFTVSHIEHSPTLTFRECLIAVALGYYLAPPATAATTTTASTTATDPNFDKIARGFRVIKSAFEEIDDDNSGMLSADEMKQALFATASNNGQLITNDVLQARFKELDINGDGDVEFKEFLYGVVSWVGMTSEEELDDIEQNE